MKLRVWSIVFFVVALFYIVLLFYYALTPEREDWMFFLGLLTAAVGASIVGWDLRRRWRKRR